MHILPVLRQIEERFEGEVVVVGVHSPKFTAEQDLVNLRSAVERLGVKHPVVSDADHSIWNSYAVRAWPTLVFIDPQGKVIGQVAGEVPYQELERIIAAMIAEFDGEGLIDRKPLRFPTPPERPLTELAYPGRVLADAATNRLFIADSEHNHIIVANLEGTVQTVVGSAAAGMEDGTFERATFHSPLGLALAGDVLYVADERNHSIRAVDLVNRRVATVAGTGQQARRPVRTGPARETALNSPWGLDYRHGVLYIAMAGFHQLWIYTPATDEVAVYAGTGHEDIRDGPRESAWLSQPSGLAFGGDNLYFADSEDSAVRFIDATGNTRTIVGRGLFDFGDVDGNAEQALLQHPLDVAYRDSIVYVADTYNNKIKRIYPKMRISETFLGSGRTGFKDGRCTQAEFAEPSGLSIAGGCLYIADTNNHAIRLVDLATGEVTTLTLRWL